MELGLISTLPILVAAASQLIMPRLVSPGRIGVALLFSLFVQTIGLAGIFWSFSTDYSFYLILFSLIFYWWGGQNAAPFWVDLISQNLPQHVFPRYFSARNTVVVLVTMGLFVLFSRFSAWGIPFQYLFLIGLMARICSLLLNFILVKKFPVTEGGNKETAGPSLNREQAKIFRQVITWGGLFRFSVNICSAFFLIYMIRDLGLSTSRYVTLAAAPFLGKALFQRNWVRASSDDRVYYGIQIATFFIALLPWLWTLSSHFAYLMALQLISGVFWGGMELTHLLMAQNQMYGNARETLGIQQAVFSSFAVLGAVVGGWLLQKNWLMVEIFNLSTVMRLVFAFVLLFNLRRFKMAKLSFGAGFDYLGTLLSVRPSLANVMRIIPVTSRNEMKK